MALVNSKLGSKVNIENVPESWSTEVFEEKIEFIWTLTNYSKIKDLALPILSPIFKRGSKTDGTEMEWQLNLIPAKLYSNNSNYVAVYLNFLSGSVTARFGIGIISQDGVVRHVQQKADVVQFSEKNPENGFSTYHLTPVKDNLLIDGKELKLYCEIVILGLKKETVERNSTRLGGAGKKKDDPLRLERLELLSQQMKSLMDKGDFETVHLRTKTKSFPALKNVLAARSREFEHMFSVKELNAIDIEGFEDSIVRAMLEYCYTGETDSLERSPEELLKISDKFQLLGLQEDCERVLEANLTVENAARILQLAHDHSPKALKPKVISFINRRMREIKDTEGFDDLIMKHPALVAELYKSLN